MTSRPHPTWKDHVEPILTQYGNLYPIMSHGFIDLATKPPCGQPGPAASRLHRPMTDPNHMPVTRDLSEAKRQTLMPGSIPATGDRPRPPGGRRPATAAGATAGTQPPSSHSVPVDSKKRFADGFLDAGPSHPYRVRKEAVMITIEPHTSQRSSARRGRPTSTR